jgi:uncharacterized protein involved in type VI secretion and phage assembly
MANEHDPGRKYLALYMGVVVDVADPEKLGRVRIRIPGVIEPRSAWAFPLGMPGAGGRKQGFFVVPPVGAEVGVFFHQGDADRPYYISGHPTRGAAPDETEDAAVSPEEATKIQVFETRRYRMTVDDRTNAAQFELKDKLTGDIIELDGNDLAIRIKATAAMRIECDGVIDIIGAGVRIQGRLVTPNGKPI